jgi:hypothetical protein
MKQRNESQNYEPAIWLVLLSLFFCILFLFSKRSALFKRWLLYPIFTPMVSMPGKSYQGTFVELTQEEKLLRERLKKTVVDLSITIGERSINKFDGMQSAMRYIADSFEHNDYKLERQTIFFDGKPMSNYVAEKKGAKFPNKIIIIGAHYDTVPGSPGADDNATGIAALLELARMFSKIDSPLTLRFIAFANEEHPGGTWESTGSYAYAANCKKHQEDIVAMLSLEMLGFYTEDEGSQNYPEPFDLFYPRVANFIAFVGNSSSKKLVQESVATFRNSVKFPCEGLAAPESISDAGRSDHRSFWQFGYPAMMVTDTSNFRYKHYHSAEDTPDKLDFERFTRVVWGLTHLITRLAEGRVI